MTRNKLVCLVFLILSVLCSCLCSCGVALEKSNSSTVNDIDSNGLYQHFSWGTSFSDCYNKLPNCIVKPADSSGEVYIPAELFFENYDGLYSKENFLSQICLQFYYEKLEKIIIDIYPSVEDIEKYSGKDDPLQAAHKEMYSFIIDEFSKRFGSGELVSRVDIDGNPVQTEDSDIVLEDYFETIEWKTSQSVIHFIIAYNTPYYYEWMRIELANGKETNE